MFFNPKGGTLAKSQTATRSLGKFKKYVLFFRYFVWEKQGENDMKFIVKYRNGEPNSHEKHLGNSDSVNKFLRAVRKQGWVILGIFKK
ncbi:MAG: hypothetical protein WCP18_01025 [bacterium]